MSVAAKQPATANSRSGETSNKQQFSMYTSGVVQSFEKQGRKTGGRQEKSLSIKKIQSGQVRQIKSDQAFSSMRQPTMPASSG